MHTAVTQVSTAKGFNIDVKYRHGWLVKERKVLSDPDNLVTSGIPLTAARGVMN